LSRIKRGPDFAGQIAKRGRSLKEYDSRIKDTVMDDSVAAISGGKHHRQSRSSGPCLVCELTAIHLRHDDVGEQQYYMGTLLHHIESCDGTIDCDNRLAELFQHSRMDLADTGVVFDKENDFVRRSPTHGSHR
jgi:hypothetical protein